MGTLKKFNITIFAKKINKYDKVINKIINYYKKYIIVINTFYIYNIFVNIVINSFFVIVPLPKL